MGLAHLELELGRFNVWRRFLVRKPQTTPFARELPDLFVSTRLTYARSHCALLARVEWWLWNLFASRALVFIFFFSLGFNSTGYNQDISTPGPRGRVRSGGQWWDDLRDIRQQLSESMLHGSGWTYTYCWVYDYDPKLDILCFSGCIYSQSSGRL